MDAMQAFEKLGPLAPSKPDWSFVPIVSAALRCNATYLRITIDQGGMIFDFDGDPLFDPEKLFEIALKANHSRPEKHLGVGLHMLNQGEPTWVSYESWTGNAGTRLKIELGKLKVEKYSKVP